VYIDICSSPAELVTCTLLTASKDFDLLGSDKLLKNPKTPKPRSGKKIPRDLPTPLNQLEEEKCGDANDNILHAGLPYPS
jgi:hypothetical protein